MIVYGFSGGTVNAEQFIQGAPYSQGGFSVLAGSSPTFGLAWTAAPLKLPVSGFQTSPFALVRNGPGDYSITWGTAIPGLVGSPIATLNVQLGAHSYSIGVVNITNGVRVTTTQDGVLTDLDFTVTLQ